jgi:hypothetical protein
MTLLALTLLTLPLGATIQVGPTRTATQLSGLNQSRAACSGCSTATVPGASAIFRLFDELESVEMHNNVIVVNGAGAPNVMRANSTEFVWVGGTRRISGSNNWTTTGAMNVPTEWTGTLSGADLSLSGSGGVRFWRCLRTGSPLPDPLPLGERETVL